MIAPEDTRWALGPLSSVAQAQTIPADALLQRLKATGHVNDFAQLLNAAERTAMEERLVQLQQKTGAEMAVVTLPSLEGGQIDDFAHKLFQQWGVGKKGKDNGLLLLVAVQDRKARIEVGYGLEAILPDALAGRVLDEQLFPAFKQQRYAEGLNQAMQRVAGIVERDEPAPPDAGKRGSGPTTVGEQIGMVLFLAVFVTIGFAALGFAIGGLAGSIASLSGVGNRWSALPGQLISSGFFLIWGAGFGGIPLFIAAQQVAWARYVHGPLAAISFTLAAGLGWRNFKNWSRRSGFGGSSGGSTWSIGGGGWSSGSSGGGGFSSDFGGFGGGSSGGGGASGGW
ncbi:MAG: TPM domain-containing protein [Pirellulaceae bacterium]|nr:TPM domain-containing protein [Pirellulaceae bacterium]